MCVEFEAREMPIKQSSKGEDGKADKSEHLDKSGAHMRIYMSAHLPTHMMTHTSTYMSAH